MFPNGLLILTQPVTKLRTQVPKMLDHVSTIISETLYIHVQPGLRSGASMQNSLMNPVPCSQDIQSFIYDIFGARSIKCQNLDIRILLSHFTNKPVVAATKYALQKPLHALISDASFLMEAWNSDRSAMVETLQMTFSPG